MDERVLELREEARKDLAKLYGHPPYGRNNLCYADGIFAKSIEDKYGMPVKQLQEWARFEVDPYGVVIAQLEQWLQLHNEHKTGQKIPVFRGTIEDMLSLMKYGTTKK